MNKLKSLLTTHYLLLSIIVIIAAFLRLYNITELPPGLYPDEAMNGNNALESLSTGDWKIFYPENNGREGLFINIQALSIALFGNFPWALRAVSAIFGILTVLGVYFLAKEIFNKNIALLSAFLLATSFWHINFSRIGFRAIMAPFFLTWGIYFLLLALRQIKEQKSPKFYILNSIFSGVFYGLGFHSYIAYRATPALILIIIALYWFQNKDPETEQVHYGASWQIRKKILLVASGYTLVAIIVFTPLGIYFIQNPQDFMGRTTQVSVFSSPTPLKDLTTNIIKTAGMFNFSGDYNWRHNYAGKPLLFWSVGILFLIGTVISIRRLFSKDFFAPIFIFSWLVIAALPVVISNEGLPHALRAIIMIPPIFILAGFGGIWLIEKIKNLTTINNSKIKLKIFYFLLFTFCFLLLINAYNTYFIKWGKNPNIQGAFAADYVQMGRELNALPKETPKYVIVEAGGTNVRGIPMPTQTIMFITDTFTPEKQKGKNIFYILPNQISQILNNKDIYTTIIK
ncbi:MAG: glycosyltransferase family 39 protein [Patescibacteria group bacterium]